MEEGNEENITITPPEQRRNNFINQTCYMWAKVIRSIFFVDGEAFCIAYMMLPKV